MRYADLETVTFTDYLGNSYPIKEMREFPTYNKLMSLPITENDRLDEIANRRDIYGSNSEIDVYRLFEMNVATIIENSFSLKGLKFIDIPDLS